MTNKDLFQEANLYFTEQESNNNINNDNNLLESVDKMRTHKVTKDLKEKIDNNKYKLIAIDTINGKKKVFLFAVNFPRVYIGKVIETEEEFLFDEKIPININVESFSSHKLFKPNLTLESRGNTVASVVRLKTGEYATILSNGEIIK